MLLSQFKWLSAGLIFLLTMVAGSSTLQLSFRRQWQMHMANALANGIFLGAGLFHLFPDAISAFTATYGNMGYLYALVLLASGYLALTSLEKWLIPSTTNSNQSLMSGLFLTFIISVHAFVAGATLGISDSKTSAWLIFIAIIAHKGCESFALILNLRRAHSNKWIVFFILIVFSFVTPAGILLTNFSLNNHLIQSNQTLIGLFNALAAGTFLYIGSAHEQHCHRHHEEGHKAWQSFVMTSCGMIAMGLIALVA